MTVLWERGSATVSDVIDSLPAGIRSRALDPADDRAFRSDPGPFRSRAYRDFTDA
jgi:hypothetical protein